MSKNSAWFEIDAKKEKPKIKKFSNVWWTCVGCGVEAYGTSIEYAYKEWARKLKMMLCNHD